MLMYNSIYISYINNINKGHNMAITKDTKNINVEVLMETWRKLKLISVSRDISLGDVIREILDKAVTKKNIDVPGE